jgi:general stress protein 26
MTNEMKFVNTKLKSCAGVLLLCAASTAPRIFAQQQPQPFSRETLIATAREIMAAARYCALITTDSAGHVQARTMDPFPPESDMTIWFGTNSKSRKVTEIRRNQRVTLYYFDREGGGYVTISGHARLVNDPKEKAKRWKDEWKAFYPDREKGYLLIAVKPQELEIVSEKKSILGDAVRWQPPTIRFGPERHRRPRGKSRPR